MSKIDDYSLRHLVEHLVRAERLAEAISLIKPDFREAKHRCFGSDFGFGRDLELVISCLEDCGQLDDLPATIRCSLIYSLLTSRVRRVPPEVLSMLVQLGESNRAIELAKLSPSGEDKAAQFLAITEALRQSGTDDNTLKRMLQETLQITRSLTRAAKGTTDLLRADIAKQAAHLDWDWCQQILDEIENLNIQARAKMQVAAEIAENKAKAIGLLQEVVPTITGDSPLIWDFSTTLAQVAQHHLEAVQSFIGSIENRRRQDLVRREVAKQLLENGSPRSALSIVEKIKVPTEPMTVIGDIMGRLAEQNVEEAYRLLTDLPLIKGDTRPLLSFIRTLLPEHVEYALKLTNRIVDPGKKCQALAQIAFLFARAHNVTKTWEYLQAVRSIIGQLSTSDISLVSLHMTISETIAEVARIDERIATEMVAEWEPTELSQHIVCQVCQLLLDRDIELTLRMAELITDPYLKGILLARVIFHLDANNSLKLALQKQVRKLTESQALTEVQVRQLQAYLLVSEGVDGPERLLSIRQNEGKPDAQESGLPTEIVINYSGGPGPSDEETTQRDDILIDLALDVAHTDVDQAFIVFRAVHPANQTRGLAQLAQVLNKRNELSDSDAESQDRLFQHKVSSADGIFVVVAQLAKQNVQLASKIVELIPDRLDQAKAYAAITLALKDKDDKGQLFKERAVAIGQTSPAAALKALAYLELDKYIPKKEQEIDFVQKAISELKINKISDVVPELTGHIVARLATKGKEDAALRLAKNMSATHAILDTPKKVEALLEVAEVAIEREKMNIGKEALDIAFTTLQLSSYALPSLPRLASLMYTYDPGLAERLFKIAIEIAMDPKMGPPQVSLGDIAGYWAPYDIQAALGTARKISDPYYRADALISVVTRGCLSIDEAMQAITEATLLLTNNSGNDLAKGYALLKLMNVDLPNSLDFCELLLNIIQRTRLTQPVDQFKRIGFLIEAYLRLRDLGKQETADEILPEALETAQNDPFHRSEGMAQVARVYLGHDHPRTLAVLYEILWRARLESYDATWSAATVIIPILCELGGSALARCVHTQLNIVEEFVSI